MGLLSFIYSVLGYNLCATLFIAYLMFDYVLGALATLGARYVMESKPGGTKLCGNQISRDFRKYSRRPPRHRRDAFSTVVAMPVSSPRSVSSTMSPPRNDLVKIGCTRRTD